MARNPHARWTTTLDDVLELKELQIRLLSHAATSVKRGGKLIYSVCALTQAETAEVKAHIDQQLSGFIPLALPSPLTPAGDERFPT